MNRAANARLIATDAAMEHQRRWFENLRQEAAAGRGFALVSADTPHEILRAMDIPYVVNQWWASIIAAGRRMPDYLRLLRERGYPDDIERYGASPLGGAFNRASAAAPWGGLPRPSFVIAELTGDAARKPFDVWDLAHDADFYPFENAAAATVPPNWWELMPSRWEETVGTDRLDLMEAELHGLIRFLENRTDRRFSAERFGEVMRLANEQAEWNRRTRDLVAAARPCPIDVVDDLPAILVPQWHRGTEWAVSAAKALHDEVARLAGLAAGPGERVRLMWTGRASRYDPELYRRFRDSHGAEFVWTRYLGIAADGYLPGGDEMRALAARFAAFADQLYTPPWSSEWHVKEARLHGVDAVVQLLSDEAPGGYFTMRALEDAGFPVLELHADDAEESRARALEDWLDHQVVPAAGG